MSNKNKAVNSTNVTKNSGTVIERSITDFLDNEYKSYANYVIESRAIPSIVDGFKPTARKVLYVGVKNVRNKAEKVSTLAGKLISDAQYHNGNVSGENVIVTMTQEFKNNMPLFDGIGNFGTLKSPFESASRYISVKLNKNYDLVFKDDELLESNYSDGIKCEPKYYLPLIPMVLVNGGTGIAVAFSTNILNRKPKDITQACIDYLQGKKIKELKPHINEFDGTFAKDDENDKKWIISGSFERVNSTYVRVTELPPSMTYQKFEALLDKLSDDKVINDYTNMCKEDINYVVKFSRESMSSLTDEDMLKTLKLVEYETENITVLDEQGKLKIFEAVEDVLTYFVDFRLSFYTKRKTFLIAKIEKELSVMDNKMRFVKAIIDGDLLVNNRKKEIIIKDLTKMKFDMQDESFDYLLRMPIYSLTKETYDKIKDDIKEKKIELSDIKKSKPKDTYISELEALKISLK